MTAAIPGPLWPARLAARCSGCASTGFGSSGSADYPQNWYDQGIAVDPNNPDRVFFDTFEVWLASRTGTAWYDLTCGYNGTSVTNHVVHVDQHALAFVNGSSDILLVGNDGGVHATLNASTAVLNTARPTWMNQDGGINAIEFYSGDISGNFATSANPSAVGGAQDNGPSSAMFSGSPTGGVQWQMGLGGDGFSGLIDPMGTGSTQAQGTITVNGCWSCRSAIPDRLTSLHLRHHQKRHRPSHDKHKHHDASHQHRDRHQRRHPVPGDGRAQRFHGGGNRRYGRHWRQLNCFC